MTDESEIENDNGGAANRNRERRGPVVAHYHLDGCPLSGVGSFGHAFGLVDCRILGAESARCADAHGILMMVVRNTCHGSRDEKGARVGGALASVA